MLSKFRFFTSGAFLLLAAVTLVASGCHDDSTGCCMICNGSCACSGVCISCTTKCLGGPGCACNSTVAPEAPAHAASDNQQMSESPDAGR